MSIATELTRIANAKTALKTAINAKGGTLTNELLGSYAAAVTALPSVFDLYKVTAYTPYSPAVPAQTGYTIALVPTLSMNGGEALFILTDTSATGTARVFQRKNSSETCSYSSANSRWEMTYEGTTMYTEDDIDDSSQTWTVDGSVSAGGSDRVDLSSSAYAGTYSVTEATKTCTGLGRQYTNANGKTMFAAYMDYDTYSCRYCTDSDTASSSFDWYIYNGTPSSAEVIQGACFASAPTVGFPAANGWVKNSYDETPPGTTTTAVQTSPATPAVQQVLTGAQATAYDTSTKAWTFSSSSTSLTGFEKTPIVDNIFACRTLKLIGNSIAYGGSLPIDQYTQMLICPKLADGSFSNLVTGSTASGTMTNVGVTLNSDNDMVFTSDSTRLLMTRANRCSGFWTDSHDWCIDQVMRANKNGDKQVVHGHDGGNAPYPMLNDSGMEYGGCNVSDSSFSYATGDWLIITTEHIASTHRTNWYVNGAIVQYMDNSSIYDSGSLDIAFWAYNTDGRWFRGAARCLRIRNNAPYQGTSFTSDLEFLKDL